jgi:hypothetical protein
VGAYGYLGVYRDSGGRQWGSDGSLPWVDSGGGWKGSYERSPMFSGVFPIGF